MKDYAKTINRSKEIHGQQQGKQTLTKSAVQTSKTLEREKKSSESGRGFFSLVAIFVIVAVLFAAYRQYIRHRAETNPQPHPVATQNSASAQPANPQFDFYTVLPNGSTTGAQAANSASAANSSTATNPSGAATTSSGTGTTTTGTTPSTTTTTAPASGTATTNIQVAPISSATAAPSEYYLNAGGFANSADAQQMLSQLLLLGVQANIQTSQDNGAPTYEVLVGPFADQDTMNIVKNQLAAHQIQATVVQN